MRIAIVGGGAMGGTFGARLANAGHEVTIVDVDAELIRTIAEEGIVVEAADGPLRARPGATADPSSAGAQDIVLVFVKAQHTRSAAEAMPPLVGPDTVIASLQNGWGNADVIADHIEPRQLVVGVTYHSATVLGRGQVKHSGQGATFIGPYRDSDLGNAERVGEALRSAGMEVTVTADVRTEIWRKLILNAATLPTAALTTLRAGELGEPGPMLALVDALASEAVAVAQAQGLSIELSERIERIHATLERAGPGKPSMLQDAEAHRKTEVERINGAVVAAADAAGVEVPLNRAMLALIGGLERSWWRDG
jgi:2-dehydropantoate 2-reductase